MRGSPLSAELEGVEDGGSLLSQVPQVDTVVSQSAHERSLSEQPKHKGLSCRITQHFMAQAAEADFKSGRFLPGNEDES